MIQRLLAFCLLPLLLLAACGEDSDPTRNNDFVPLTGITVVSQYPVMAAGTSNQFSAIGEFSGLFTREITEEVTWNSSVEEILAISNAPGSRGLAKSTSPTIPTVTVTASLEGIEAATEFTVTDAQIQTLVVTPNPATVPRSGTLQFTATGAFSAGPVQDITRDVIWTSDLPDIASIGETTGLAQGLLVTGPQETVTISATLANATSNPNAETGTAALTVTAPVVESIRLSPEAPILTVGETHQFSAIPVLSDGSVFPAVNATWSSSAPTVATVDETTGLVEAVAVGTTTISGEDAASGFIGTMTVTVSTVTAIAITPADPSITVGNELQLTATATMADGSSRDITPVATWTTSNNQIVSLDGAVKGKVVGNTVGSANVTATRGVGGTTRVTVTAAPLPL